MMNTEFMKGVVVPILTVIDGEEKIDEAGMRDQVEYVIQAASPASLPLAPTANSTWWKRTRWSVV